MNINQLISIVKKKINHNLKCENVEVEDKTFLHVKHKSSDKNKFHIQIKIKSFELKKLSKIDSNKRVYKILKKEIKNNIHSIQILID